MGCPERKMSEGSEIVSGVKQSEGMKVTED